MWNRESVEVLEDGGDVVTGAAPEFEMCWSLFRTRLTGTDDSGCHIGSAQGFSSRESDG